MKRRVLVTAHHILSPDSGVGQITNSILNTYRENEEFSVFFLDHTSIRFIPEKLRYVVFPVVVWLRVFYSLIKGNPFELVHSTTGDAALLSLLPVSRPVIVTQSHNIEPLSDYQKRLKGHKFSFKYLAFRSIVVYPFVHLSLKNSDLVFVLNPLEKEYIHNRYGDKGFLILNSHNFVFESLPELPRTDTIVINGTSIVRKNADDFLPIFSKLSLKYKDIRLLLLGGDSNYVNKIDLDMNRVLVIEEYSNTKLPELLKGCSIYVSLSMSEGFPIFLMEASRLGLIPVLSKIPAHIFYAEISPISILVDSTYESISDGIEKALTFDDSVRQDLMNWAKRNNRSDQMSLQLVKVRKLLKDRS